MGGGELVVAKGDRIGLRDCKSRRAQKAPEIFAPGPFVL